MNRLSVSLVVLFGAAASAQTLPPDHPPIGGTQPAAKAPGAALPPGHPPVAESQPSNGAAPGGLQTAEQLLAELDKAEGLKGGDKPFQVAASMGKLYYGNGRFADALVHLKQAVDKGDEARTLYLDNLEKAKGQRKDIPPATTVGCANDPKDAFEQQLQTARQKAKEKDVAAAASCARAALTPVLQIRSLYAAALFNTGEPSDALKVLEQSLEAAPDDAESLFAHATILIDQHGNDVAQVKKAKSQWERFLVLRPDAPRSSFAKKLVAQAEQVIAAGGVDKLGEARAQKARGSAQAQPSAPPQQAGLAPLSQEAVAAFQNTERTPELVSALQQLLDEGEALLAKGQFQQALDKYKQVIPYEPQNGRAQAGMAWALVGLNRQPMADNIWKVAVSTDPAAVDALGKTLQQKGDKAGATALWARLAVTDPAYAEKNGLNARAGN